MTTSRRKKGGMSDDIEFIGAGDEGCVFRDRQTNHVYKLLVPRVFVDQTTRTKVVQIPSEIEKVKLLHQLHTTPSNEKKEDASPHSPSSPRLRHPLNRSIFKYPDLYEQISKSNGKVKAILEKLNLQCKKTPHETGEEKYEKYRNCRFILERMMQDDIEDAYIARMDYAGTPLEELKNTASFQKFTWKELGNILEQFEGIVTGLKHAHKVHGDIHPRNITVTGFDGVPDHRDIKIQVIDFGNVKEWNYSDGMQDERDIVDNVLRYLLSSDLIDDKRVSTLKRKITFSISKLHDVANKSREIDDGASTSSSRKSQKALRFDDDEEKSPAVTSPLHLNAPHPSSSQKKRERSNNNKSDSPFGSPVRKFMWNENDPFGGGSKNKNTKPKTPKRTIKKSSVH